MKILSSLNKRMESLFINVSFVLLAIFTVVVLLQIFTRNWLSIYQFIFFWSDKTPVFDIPWTEEVSKIAYFWTLYLGSAVGVRMRKHYVIELTPKVWILRNAALDIFADIMMLVLIIILIVYGYKFSVMGLSRNSESLEIPMFYVFIAMPVAGVGMLSFWLEQITNDIKKILGRE